MKEFDLVAAKKGQEVCLRDGHDARIICFNAKDKTRPPIIILNREISLTQEISRTHTNPQYTSSKSYHPLHS